MIRGVFTDIADIYDRMNHVLSLGLDRRWRRLAAKGAADGPRRILDLACGTGDFTFELARRFGGAEVLGMDFTPAMLEIAKGKNHSPRISFVAGDAMDLSRFSAGSFDLCSCAFGFRNFSDRDRVLAEARRVLTQRGELLVLEFFRPESKILWFFTSLWLRMLTAVFVRKGAVSYGYLRESIGRMDRLTDFLSRAEESGFTLRGRDFFFPCCTCLHLTIGTCRGDAEKAKQN